MNNLRNRVQLIGYVGNDPEIKTGENGQKRATISLATNDHYKNAQGEKVEQTEWHRLTAWGATAEIVEQLVKKGKEIAVEGKLTHRSYDDKNGEKRYVTDIVINEILLLGK